MNKPKMTDKQRELMELADQLQAYMEPRGIKFALMVDTGEGQTGLFGSLPVALQAILNYFEEQQPGIVEQATEMMRSLGIPISAIKNPQYDTGSFDESDLTTEQRILLRSQERLAMMQKKAN